jgi:Type I phosphodiesterase / nucleotide pyrophosphatase
MQLRQIDRLVESVIEHMPPEALLAVVADHGMVAVDTADVIDADGCDPSLEGVQAIGGEPRTRHIYVRAGAADDVLAAWREILIDRAWVVSREEAISAGWFGERVVAAARGSAAVVRRTVEPLESSLIGHHGSLTSAEQRIPLLLAYG